MTPWLVLLAGLAAAPLAVLGYAGSRMGQPPRGNPADLLADGSLAQGKPVVVCVGDSITQAALGADWVHTLRERLGADAVVVNAGEGGQVAWDLRQRLDSVAQCKPDAIVLLAGSNDAVGALGGSWASFYTPGRPQAPSEAWFAEQYDALVGELHQLAPNVLCLTLPPLGEDPTHPVQATIDRQNQAIRASASRHGVDRVDLHTAFVRLTPRNISIPGAPFMRGPAQFMRWGLSSIVRHRMLGQTWDAIGESRGFQLTADSIHPNERAANAMLELIEPWVRNALRGRITP